MATLPRTGVPPVPLVRLVERFRHRLYRVHQRLAPAAVAMMDLILAGWMSQAIEAAAELGIADALDALDRLLRALVSRGVFRRHGNGAYGLNRYN